MSKYLKWFLQALAQDGTIKAVAARYDITTRHINIVLREARDDARTELGRNQDVRIQP